MRGKILKDTNAGEGVIFINDGQKSFSLEQWKSGIPPKVGGVVEVETDVNGNVLSVMAVDESTLAKEQAQKTLNTIGIYGKECANAFLARVSPRVLACLAMLVIAWIFMSIVNINISKSLSESASLYDILKLVNIDGDMSSLGSLKNYGAGFYGLLMWICLLAPLASHFYEHKNLALTYCVPLVFLTGVGISLYFTIQSYVSKANVAVSFFGNDQQAKKLMTEMMSMAMKSISLGYGFYLSLVVSIYLASIGIKKYFVNKAM